LPLYEAKLTSQYNHRHGTFAGVPAVERFGVRAQTNKPTLEEISNPELSVLPRYWVEDRFVEESVPKEWRNRWFLGFRNAISAVADSRSISFALIPRVAVGNSMPLLFCYGPATESAMLLANFNSFVLDYVGRQKASGGNLNFYVVKQLPVLPPTAYTVQCSWTGTKTLKRWLISRILELTYTAWDLQAFALDCGFDGPPFRWNEERRFRLACELDAAFFQVYLGLESEWHARSDSLTEHFPTPRQAVAYIMETFPIVKGRDEEKYDTYRTKDTILKIYDELAESQHTGRAYVSPLNPPPGPPTDEHGHFIPMSQWDPNHWPSHIHPPRDIGELKAKVIDG
jgi:hypothetical protein